MKNKPTNHRQWSPELMTEMLFDHMEEAIVVVEPVSDLNGNYNDYRFLMMNAAGEKAIGKSRAELLNRLRTETLGPMDEATMKGYKEVLEQKIKPVIRERFFPDSGKWIEVRAYYSNGKIFSLGIDITNRRLIEQQLEEETEWLRFLNLSSLRLNSMSNLKDGMQEIIKTTIKLTGADKSTIQLFDKQSNSLMIEASYGFENEFLYYFHNVKIGDDSVCGKAFSERKQMVSNDVQHDRSFIQHLKIFKKENIRSVQSTPLYDQNGNTIGMMSSHSKMPNHFSVEILRRMELYARFAESFPERIRNQDRILKMNMELEKKITERTEELTNAMAIAKKEIEMKSRFVSIASHELRAPLSTILTSTYLLQHYNENIQEKKKHIQLERIKSSANSLSNILDDFLSLDKLEKGVVVPTNSQINIKKLVNDIAEKLNIFCKQNQKIFFHYEGVPHGFLDFKITEIILANLLNNAIKYSDTNIQLQVVNSKNILKMSVTDHGIGISAADKKNIFQPFFRGKNAAHIKGIGLGLNIVSQYVGLLNGSINFISSEKKGTTFNIEVPC